MISYIGPCMPLMCHLNPSNGDTTYTCIVSDLAGSNWFEQYSKSTCVPRLLWYYTVASRFVFEGCEVFERMNNRLIKPQDIEAITVCAARVAHFDDGAARIVRLRCKLMAVLTSFKIQRGVDKGVERLGRYFKWLAALHLLERIPHNRLPYT